MWFGHDLLLLLLKGVDQAIITPRVRVGLAQPAAVRAENVRQVHLLSGGNRHWLPAAVPRAVALGGRLFLRHGSSSIEAKVLGGCAHTNLADEANSLQRSRVRCKSVTGLHAEIELIRVGPVGTKYSGSSLSWGALGRWVKPRGR